MANELSIQLIATYTKNNETFAINETFTVTVAGSYPKRSVISVGITDETLALDDVGATPGWLFLKNKDTTNYIQFGLDGTNYASKLKAGESQMIRWNGSAIHAKANTAACDLAYILFPD